MCVKILNLVQKQKILSNIWFKVSIKCANCLYSTRFRALYVPLIIILLKWALDQKKFNWKLSIMIAYESNQYLHDQNDQYSV